MGSVNMYGLWSGGNLEQRESKIRKECVSRYRERGSHRASLAKARGSKLSAERQENLERGSVRGAAWREGRPTSAIDALRIIYDGKQGLRKIPF